MTTDAPPRSRVSTGVLIAIAVTVLAWASAFIVIRGTAPYFTGGPLLSGDCCRHGSARSRRAHRASMGLAQPTRMDLHRRLWGRLVRRIQCRAQYRRAHGGCRNQRDARQHRAHPHCIWGGHLPARRDSALARDRRGSLIPRRDRYRDRFGRAISRAPRDRSGACSPRCFTRSAYSFKSRRSADCPTPR